MPRNSIEGSYPASPQPEREQRILPTHRIKTRKPEGTFDAAAFREIKDESMMTRYLTDEANFPGGKSPKIVQLRPNASEAVIAAIIRQCAAESTADSKGIVTIGAQSSLTGASVPKGEVVLDMTQRKEIFERQKNIHGDETITAQSGASVEDLQKELAKDGFFLPSAPTHEGATIGGIVNTDAGGAKSYKYGKTREYVDGLTIVLASGKVVDIDRGEYLAHPADNDHPTPYFELATTDGSVHTIPVPEYEMPDVPKVSAGYYTRKKDSGADIDLLDLIIGSEGTLGIVTDVRFKVRKAPQTAMMIIPCTSEEQALDLNRILRDQEVEKREKREPGGISAVEYIGENSLHLIQNNVHVKQASFPEDTKSLLIVQVETPEGDLDSIFQVVKTCADLNIDDDNLKLAESYDTDRKKEFIDIREAVPLTFNETVVKAGLTKIGADPCVSPERLIEMNRIYTEAFEQAGIEMYSWGHGEGNIHYSALPDADPEQIEIAKQIILECGRRVITELGGSGMAEHAVGKNPIKQALLREQIGETGIAQMQALKDALDPEWLLAPGNIIPKPNQ